MKIIKGLILSVSALAAGFIAMVVPFKMLGNLTSQALHIVFITELIVYFVTGCIFLLIIDKKKKDKAKNEYRHARRCEKIKRVQDEWINIAA